MEKETRDVLVIASMVNDLKLSGFKNTVEVTNAAKELFSLVDVEIDSLKGKIRLLQS